MIYVLHYIYISRYFFKLLGGIIACCSLYMILVKLNGGTLSSYEGYNTFFSLSLSSTRLVFSSICGFLFSQSKTSMALPFILFTTWLCRLFKRSRDPPPSPSSNSSELLLWPLLWPWDSEGADLELYRNRSSVAVALTWRTLLRVLIGFFSVR